MTARIETVCWASHRGALNEIRNQVFVVEQQVPQALEWDGLDAGAKHLLASTPNGHWCGCARLLPSGQIGRIAVLPAFRRQGIGRRLLDSAVALAGADGLSGCFLHAQQHLAEYYGKAGFLIVGEPFMEAGIPHVRMTLDM